MIWFKLLHSKQCYCFVYSEKEIWFGCSLNTLCVCCAIEIWFGSSCYHSLPKHTFEVIITNDCLLIYLLFFFFNISAYSNTKGFLCSFMLFLFLKGVTNTQKLPCACLCLDKKWDQNKEPILMLLHINLHVLIPSKPLLLLPPLCVYGLVT